MAIDDPLDQLHAQHRDRDQTGVLAPVLNVSAIVLGLMNPGIGAAVGIAALVNQLLDTRRSVASAAALHTGLVDAFRMCEGRQETVEEKVKGLDAEEAFVKAARAALMTPRLEKARRMGQILGSTLAADTPNWAEAAEFIATLEDFGDDDIRALKTLWLVQRAGMRVVEDGQRKMSTDANDYTSTWKDVLASAQKAGLGHEEWYSQCGRLTGFGLVLPVQSNQAHQGPGAICYRLTTKATRLLNALGYKADPSAYPKWIYRPGGQKRLVQDHDEYVQFGEGWFETPQL